MAFYLLHNYMDFIDGKVISFNCLGMDKMKDNRWRLLDIFTQLLEGKAIKISELVEKKYGTEDTIAKIKIRFVNF